MATRILPRRDTAANWTSANPTLAAGELGRETDTGRSKTGDGATAWTSLAYNDRSRQRVDAREVWVEDQTGADFTAKFRAGVTAHLADPGSILRWDASSTQTISLGSTPITIDDGFCLSPGGVSQAEFTPTGQAVLGCTATAGVFQLQQGSSARTRNVRLTNTLFSLSSGTDLFQQVTDGATGPILEYSSFEGISVNGGRSVFYGRMLGCRWLGKCYVNNTTDTPFRLWGSDNFLWTDGLFLDSPNLADTEYLMICENLSKTVIGFPFITGDGPTPVRVNAGRLITFVQAYLEGQDTDSAPRPMAGAALWVAGGAVTLTNPWFFRAMQDPSETGRGDNGTVHVTGGLLTLHTPMFAENGTAETHNHIYASGGTVRVVGPPNVHNYEGSSTTYAAGRAFQWEEDGGQIEFYGSDPTSAPRPLVSRLTSSVTSTSTTTLQATALSVTLAASRTYDITGFLTHIGSESGDGKISFTGPAGATAAIMVGQLASGASGTTSSVGRHILPLDTGWDIGLISTSTTGTPFEGWVATGTTSGALTVQWAQRVSNTNASVLHAGSRLVATEW
jgi:Major tropism determinant N-terminal domain